MNRYNKIIALFFCCAMIILFSTPITASAALFQEICLTEESAGVSHTEQRFVIIDASGAVTEYVYNHKGLLIKETNPLGEETNYEYDVLDRLSKTITPDGTLTTYTYDVTGNVARITAQKASGEREELQYAYTPEGYLASAISETTADEYTYTENGEIASVTRNGTYRIELCHDDAGKLVELRECHLDGNAENSVTNYEYDSAHRLVKVVQDGNLLSEYGYDTAGRLKYQQDGTGSITEYSYGSSNRPVLMETRTAEGIVLYREENGYNENGVATQYMTYNGMVLAAYNTAGERTEHYSYGKKILARE